MVDPAYEPPGWDEAIDANGEPRPHYAALIAALADTDLRAAEQKVARLLDQRDVGFTSAGGAETFHVDPVPRILDPDEWRLLDRGLSQRATALNAFVRDVYGQRLMLAAGRIPAWVVDSADHYEPRLAGCDLGEHPASIVGFDVVRGADGRLAVLEDNCRTPSGFSYAVAAREVLTEVLPGDAPPRADPVAAVELIRGAIAASAGRGHAVVISDGPSNSAWFEHRDLSRRLGIPLVTPDALRRDGARLLCEIDGGEQAVSLVYRRTDDDRLTEADGALTALGELMLEPIRAGELIVWNAFGAGVADDKLVHAYVEEMIAFYLGEEPVVRSVPTFDLSRAETRGEVLDRLDEMVIKPRVGLGGQGVVICAHATDEDRARIAAEIEAQPRDFIAQETLSLSTHPSVADGRLEPRHVDLRAYAVVGKTAPVAMTRFARERGALVVNSSEGGGIKDTWILT